MPQLPVPDDLGVFEIEERVHHEKVFVKDLAHFLGVGVACINKYAKSKDWLHKMKIDPWRSLAYVTPFAAARIIVYVRAMQQWKIELKAGRRRRIPAP